MSCFPIICLEYILAFCCEKWRIFHFSEEVDFLEGCWILMAAALLRFVCVVQLCSYYVRMALTTLYAAWQSNNNLHSCVLPRHVFNKCSFCKCPPKRGCETLCHHGETKLCS